MQSLKKYQTRDGCEVRIYATDGDSRWPVHGAVRIPHSMTSTPYWHSMIWTIDGHDHNKDYKGEWDLIEIPAKKTFEVGKKYRTRGGNIAQIYATDCNGDRPIRGDILVPGQDRKLVYWCANGRFYNDGDVDDWDLTNLELYE